MYIPFQIKIKYISESWRKRYFHLPLPSKMHAEYANNDDNTHSIQVPRVYSLSIFSELAVVKLVHRAAINIENEEDSNTELVDGDSYGLAGKIRIHSEGNDFTSLLSKIDAVRNYLEENLISMLSRYKDDSLIP